MPLIENEFLSVELSSRGGTLRSIFSKKDQLEYLWQGDPAYWGGRAPNLFPFVGRLLEGRYIYQGKSYAMTCHGFLSKMDLSPRQAASDRCIFLLTDTPATLEVYPFRFWMEVRYALEGQRINICFRVKNCDEKTMYCGFGGHPGFRVPLEEGLSFEDYSVYFPDTSAREVVNFSQGVLTESRSPYLLTDGCRLPLRHSLFHHDAVVLTGGSREVTIRSEKSPHGVTVRYPDMPYVGFWHKANVDAPFVCVEPWSVLPGREGVVEDIEQMPDLTRIMPGETVENHWSIEIF